MYGYALKIAPTEAARGRKAAATRRSRLWRTILSAETLFLAKGRASLARNPRLGTPKHSETASCSTSRMPMSERKQQQAMDQGGNAAPTSGSGTYYAPRSGCERPNARPQSYQSQELCMPAT
eukprot:scaffold88074_cov31-Tisochrysis_lutea.AAC.2